METVKRNRFFVTQGSMTYLSSVVYRYVMKEPSDGQTTEDALPAIILPLLGVNGVLRTVVV